MIVYKYTIRPIQSMDSVNNLIVDVIDLDVNPENISYGTSIKSCSSSKSTCFRLTSVQVKKQFMNRMEERIRDLFENTSLYCPKKRCSDSEFVIPKVNESNVFLSYKYKKSQLQDITRHYKLPVSGTVSTLVIRIYTYLIIHAHVIPFQSLWRGYLRRKCNILRGPAYLDRSVCNNDEDFLTGDTMKEIVWDQFVSYKAADGFIYGFDIVSLYNLKLNSKMDNVLNPYTREVIPLHVFSELRVLIDIEKNIYNNPLDITIEKPEEEVVSPRNMPIEQRVGRLFAAIESHGYYPTSAWFMELETPQLIRLLRELADIFIYRASIPRDVQMRICPENPFRSVSTMVNIMQSYDDILVSRDILLYVSNSVVMSGVNVEDRSLGTIIFLQALTLVNEGAREAFPLFYESAAYT